MLIVGNHYLLADAKIFKNLIYAIISPNKYRKSITFVNLK